MIPNEQRRTRTCNWGGWLSRGHKKTKQNKNEDAYARTPWTRCWDLVHQPEATAPSTPCTAAFIVKPTWQAALASRVEDELRSRCRRGCRRSQKCGHCVHWRQPPERSFGSISLQTCQMLYIDRLYNPASAPHLHTWCGAVRAASLRPQSCPGMPHNIFSLGSQRYVFCGAVRAASLRPLSGLLRPAGRLATAPGATPRR